MTFVTSLRANPISGVMPDTGSSFDETQPSTRPEPRMVPPTATDGSFVDLNPRTTKVTIKLVRAYGRKLTARSVFAFNFQFRRSVAEQFEITLTDDKDLTAIARQQVGDLQSSGRLTKEAFTEGMLDAIKPSTDDDSQTRTVVAETIEFLHRRHTSWVGNKIQIEVHGRAQTVDLVICDEASKTVPTGLEAPRNRNRLFHELHELVTLAVQANRVNRSLVGLRFG